MIASPVCDNEVILEDDRRERERWLKSFKEASKSLRPYSSLKETLEALISWQKAEPECRRQVAKDVIREISHDARINIDLYPMLVVLASRN